MVNIQDILERHKINVSLKGDLSEVIKRVYTTIQNSEDPLSVAEHVILFDIFWKQATGNKAKLSDALKIKIIQYRYKIPAFHEVVQGFLVRKDIQSLTKICKLNPEEDAEIWSLFHILVPQFSKRDSYEINKILGTYNLVNKKIKELGKINVLDIGCGSHGRGISTLVSKYESKILGFGIDMNVQEHPTNVRLTSANALLMPYDNDFFDIVYAAETIYYFEGNDLIKLIQEVIRVLKQGGVFVFNDYKHDADYYKQILINKSIDFIHSEPKVFLIIKQKPKSVNSSLIKSKNSIKLMNYNICYGFHSPGPNPQLDKERLELAKKIVNYEAPDILIFTEACFGKFMDYKNLFQFKYGYFGPWSKEWGNCLLSNYPLKAELAPFGNRTAIRATINIQGKELHMDIIHPDPENTDDDYIRATLPLLKSMKTPYIITGDFNSLSDEDKYKKSSLLKGFQSFAGKKTEYLVNKLLQRKFIPFIKSQGLLDALPKSKRKYTIPTNLLSKDKSSAIRIDYFFISEDIKVIDAETIQNSQTEKASDHYPICCIIVV